MNSKPNCPFCLDNHMLKGDILAKTEGGYVVDAMNFPGRYLIIPEQHAESIAALPDNWLGVVKTLLPQIPGQPSDYNLSFNIGKVAGQTLPHLHLWVIPREAGQPASNMGLATLIDAVNRQ